MGNYVIREHVIARLGSDVVGNLTLPSMPITLDEYFDFMIENTEEFIDGYLRIAYTTPIVSDASNGFLRELTLDFIEYEIWKRAVGDDVPTKYKVTMERAMKVLTDITEGVITPFPSGSSKNISMDIQTDTMVMDETSLSSYN